MSISSEIENKRYALEPCIKPFAQFNEYKNKNLAWRIVGQDHDLKTKNERIKDQNKSGNVKKEQNELSNIWQSI